MGILTKPGGGGREKGREWDGGELFFLEVRKVSLI